MRPPGELQVTGLTTETMTEWPVVGLESIFDRVAPSSYNNKGTSFGRSLPDIGSMKRPRVQVTAGCGLQVEVESAQRPNQMRPDVTRC